MPEIDVTPQQAAELIRAGAQLVDVREDYEYDAGRIEGATRIGLDRLAAQAETLDRRTPLLFYCRVGARSAMAAQAFRRSGFDAYSMTGGLVEWQASGLPLEPEDGHVAAH